MKIEEVLKYIEEDLLPERFAEYKLQENELLQHAVSASCLSYVQRSLRPKDQLIYRIPEKIVSIADMIKLLIERGVLKTLFLRKEVCDLTVAQFSREDIIRVSSREEGREEGRKEEKHKIALRMYGQGFTVAEIADMINEVIEVVQEWTREKDAAQC